MRPSRDSFLWRPAGLVSAAAATPHGDGLTGRGRGPQRGQVLARGVLGLAEGLVQGVLGGGEVLLELGDPPLQGVDLVLELEDPADPFEADPRGGQLGDLAEQFDVPPRVPPAAATGAAGADDSQPVVGAQGLGVQPGELGGHADHVDRHVGSGGADPGPHPAAHDAPPGRAANRLARRSVPLVASRNASTAARAFSSSAAGTCTSTVTIRSPAEPLAGPLVCVTPRPRTRKLRPFGVPAGIFRVTGAPSSVGTLISAPSAASSKLTGTVRVRLSPLRPKSGWPATLTLT